MNSVQGHCGRCGHWVAARETVEVAQTVLERSCVASQTTNCGKQIRLFVTQSIARAVSQSASQSANLSLSLFRLLITSLTLVHLCCDSAATHHSALQPCKCRVQPCWFLRLRSEKVGFTFAAPSLRLSSLPSLRQALSSAL